MPRFERWDVVAVPFPYVERPIQQRRPARLPIAEARYLVANWVITE
jgi:hypothetical protein